MGLLAGFGFVLFYSLLGIPIARVADRLNRRNIVAVAFAFWSAMTALCGMASSVTSLALARIGVGIGESAGSPASQSIVAHCRAMCDFVRMGCHVFDYGNNLRGEAYAGGLSDATAMLAKLICHGPTRDVALVAPETYLEKVELDAHGVRLDPNLEVRTALGLH